MARSIWSGVITFGMVSIPVKLYAATESKDIAFHQIHQECGSRLRQLRWCPVCEREVELREVVRGYEYARDQHIVLTAEDFENWSSPASTPSGCPPSSRRRRSTRCSSRRPTTLNPRKSV